MDVAALKKAIRVAIELHDKHVQIDEWMIEIGEASGHTMEIDEENLEANKDVDIKTMKNLQTHKINALKKISQNVHGNHLALEGVEYKCSYAIGLLTPLLNTWGPYMQFFD